MREIDRSLHLLKKSEEVSSFEQSTEYLLQNSSFTISRLIQQGNRDFDWPDGIDQSVRGIIGTRLQEFFDVLALAADDSPRSFERFQDAREKFWERFVSEIKRRRRHKLLNDFSGMLFHLQESYFEERHPEIAEVLGLEREVLYYLLCEEDKIMAGSRGGLYWKKVFFDNHPEEDKSTVWSSIISQMKGFYNYIGRAEVELVPERFLLMEDFEKLNLPVPARSIEELLEDAYYNQRYAISSEGAEVHIQRAGDLEIMIVKIRGDELTAKAITTLGEVLIALNIDRAEPITPEIVAKQEPRLVHILAEVYHDLVVAVEVPSLPRRKRKTPQLRPIEERGLTERTFIYIPRKIRVGGEEKEFPARIPYQGERRPPRPHGFRLISAEVI